MSQIVASGSTRAEETLIRAVNRGWLEETGFAHNVSCAWGLPPLIRAGRLFMIVMRYHHLHTMPNLSGELMDILGDMSRGGSCLVSVNPTI